MLTGIKDLDYKILNQLEDRDLVNICQVNKEADSICQDETFWLNRIVTRFPKVPSEIFIENRNGRSWADYYIKDLRKINTMEPNEILIDGAKTGKEDWIIIALNRGADVHAPDDLGPDAALRYASQYGHTEVIKILIQNGANVHAENDYALILASMYGHPAVVKILLGAGADVHAENDLALRFASQYGHSEVVKILLEAGADVHADNDQALRWARQKGYTEVVKLLEQYM